MPASRFLAAALTTLAVAARLSASAAPPNTYAVTIDTAARTAHVDARLWLPTPSLALFGVEPVDGLPNGQADLITNLTAATASGSPLAIERLPEGDFTIAAAGDIRLSYDVKLEHDRYSWPAGTEEVSYWTAQGLMITGSALLVAPGDVSDRPYRVSFSLPDGWRAVTPWRSLTSETFDVPTRRELLTNAMFLGTIQPERVTMGGVELTLAIGDCCSSRKAQFVELLRAQLRSYEQLFGGSPRASRYLIIVNAGDSGDGGAFAGSFSQFIKGSPDAASRVVWGHVMAHELLHFWNGLSLVPADSREEWFKEGVTDYLTLTTMKQNGFIDRDALFKRLENANRKYVLARLMQRLTMPVRASGENKQQNRFLVYAGGTLAALALDVEIRRSTQDAKGLPDVMRALFAEFGAGRPYELADIVRVARSATGVDVAPLLKAAVESEGWFDVSPWLREAGLRLDQAFEEQFLSVDTSATPLQRRRFERIFGAEAAPVAKR